MQSGLSVSYPSIFLNYKIWNKNMTLYQWSNDKIHLIPKIPATQLTPISCHCFIMMMVKRPHDLWVHSFDNSVVESSIFLWPISMLCLQVSASPSHVPEGFRRKSLLICVSKRVLICINIFHITYCCRSNWVWLYYDDKRETSCFVGALIW